MLYLRRPSDDEPSRAVALKSALRPFQPFEASPGQHRSGHDIDGSYLMRAKLDDSHEADDIDGRPISKAFIGGYLDRMLEQQ